MGQHSPHIRNGHAWRKARARILASQDTCSWCGGWVDKTLHYLDPGAPQVDHINPTSRGGHPVAIANLRLMHRKCNRDRSNRLDPPANRTTQRW